MHFLTLRLYSHTSAFTNAATLTDGRYTITCDTHSITIIESSVVHLVVNTVYLSPLIIADILNAIFSNLSIDQSKLQRIL